MQTLLGQRVPGGDRGLALPELRPGAGIALSPIPPLGLPARVTMDRVRAHLPHVTGTQDHDFVGGNGAESRRIPYDAIAASGTAMGQVLAVLAGAAHGSFADEPGTGGRWRARLIAPVPRRLRWPSCAAYGWAMPEQRHLIAQDAPGLLAEGDVIERKGLAP
ncbi:MAG: acetylhydrolase [Roseomonas sp.]|nr:acetylhydrolase [Roseomonas sp.]